VKRALRYLLSFSIFLFAGFSLKAQTDGLFFGMTYQGGNLFGQGYGVINQFDPLSYKDTAVYDFTGLNGAEPYGNFIQLNNGLLYGMTAYNCTSPTTNPLSGTILQYNLQTGKDSILYVFPSTGGSYDSGEYTYGSLCYNATTDLLYGLTCYGGSHSSGVIFSLNYHNGNYKVLTNLRGIVTGAAPTGSLILVNDSLLFGLTTIFYPAVGPLDTGTILKYNINTGVATRVYAFSGAPNDGSYPRGSLLQVNDSMLYGLTINGGVNNDGILFGFNINTNIETVLINFTGPNGSQPQLSLMQASDGNLYGTTYYGGAHDSGTIFKYNIGTNTETVVYSFNGSDTDGYYPSGDLIQATDGKLYGNTLGNTNFTGKNNWGTIFRYDPVSHSKKTLCYYNDTNGMYPYGDFLEVMNAKVSAVKNPCPNDSSGSLTIHVRGGKLPLTYSWSTGATTSSITNLKSGIYSDTVWDARGIRFVTIDTLFPLPIVMAFTTYNPCYDSSTGSAAISVSGGTSPYSYLWSNGNTTDSATNLSGGTYSCKVTDASGCFVTKTVVITQATNIIIDSIVATKQTPNNNNGTVTVYVKGGVPPGDVPCYYYLWSNGGPDSATITGLDTGTYSVCVTSCYGCGSSCSDSAKIVLGTSTINNETNFAKVYPVPSTGLITLSLAGNGFENLEITDALGRRVYQESLNSDIRSNTLQIDLSAQPNGVYILYVNTQQGPLTRKIIIQK